MENNKLNGFNNGRDTTDGVGGKDWIPFVETVVTRGFENMGKQEKLREAVEVLCNALREDTTEGSYYHSWQANIAMAFKDEFHRHFKVMDKTYNKEEIHNIANQAAKDFLNLLIK